MPSVPSSLYSIDNPVFASFCFYAAVLTLKTLFMAFLTGFTRVTKLVSSLFIVQFIEPFFYLI